MLIKEEDFKDKKFLVTGRDILTLIEKLKDKESDIIRKKGKLPFYFISTHVGNSIKSFFLRLK